MNSLFSASVGVNKTKARPINKLRLRLSLSGFFYIIVVVVVYLFAVNFSSNLLLTLVFFLVGILASCFWLSVSNIRSINVLTNKVDPVHKDQVLKYKLTVSNIRRNSCVDLLANGQIVDDITHGKEQSWVIKKIAEKRGMYSNHSLVVTSRWPLGLFKLSVMVITLPEVVIYPKSVSVDTLKKTLKSEKARNQNDADILVGLKDYQQGDIASRIDWRVMARRDQLLVKLFDGGSGDASLFLDWDDTDGMAYEHRISVLCRRILDCQQQGVEFGLRLPGFGLSPANNAAHIHECLMQLAVLPFNDANRDIESGRKT